MKAILTYLAFVLMPLISSAATHPLQTWRERLFIPAAQTGFNSVAWGNGQFVAVGGTITAASTNGVDWLSHNTGVTGSLRAVAYGSTQFVAVGLYGVIASSPDGTNWVERSPATATYHLTDIVYGDGKFVAVGEGGRILVSSDAVEWVQASSGTTFRLDDVEYGNGLFLMPFMAGTNLLSRDGTNWIRVPSGTRRGLYTIGFGGGRFLQVDTDRQVWTSPDATNWTHRGAISGIRPPCAGWGNGEFLIAANPALEYWDGAGWVSAGTNITASGIAFGNGAFVVAAGSRLYQSDPVIKLQMVGPAAFYIVGPPGSYGIDSASSLGAPVLWDSITNVLVTNSPTRWFDAQGSNSGMRVYRVGFTGP